jgi:threonylcarbamoyladenosine tRNA methylthiotransferase MtaB
MKTFTITTLGCKVNQYESQQIRELLEKFDLTLVKPEDSPDLAIINTCCVTHTASAKSRQFIRKIHNYSRNSTVVVAGCLPVGQIDELKDLDNDGKIHIVRQKNHLARTLSSLIYISNSTKACQTSKIKDKTGFPLTKGLHELESLHSYKGQSRAFLKIQDGCDGYCSYCIVPTVRSEIKNKAVKDVVEEAYRLVYAGHAEIVLTGIFLGAYGRDTVRRKHWDSRNDDILAGLLRELTKINGLERIRLSSLEPADVTDGLLETLCDHPNIMPHLHLPLQSGSQSVLRKMCRQYTVDEFLQIVDKVRQKLDRPAITTDIIVGFPGETDEDFQKTVFVAEKCGFSKMHVFSYSERKNTAAVMMQPKVRPEVINSRSLQLRQMDEKLQLEFCRQFEGEEVEVVVEGTSPVRGRTRRYFMAEFADIEPESVRKGDVLTGVFRLPLGR